MANRRNIREAQETSGLIARIDLAVVEAAAPYEHHPAVRVAGPLSDLADQPPLVAVSLATMGVGLTLRDPRLARTGLRMLASHALATALKVVIKNSADRSRPGKVAEEGEHEFEAGGSENGEDRSFPSGHTAGAVAVARAVSREYPAAALPTGLAATAAAVVQVPRTTHHPSDVIVGAMIGLGAEVLIDRAMQALTPARRIYRWPEKRGDRPARR